MSSCRLGWSLTGSLYVFMQTGVEYDRCVFMQSGVEHQAFALSCFPFILFLWLMLYIYNLLVGLVVKASASRAEDPGLESRLRRDFFFFRCRVIPVT